MIKIFLWYYKKCDVIGSSLSFPFFHQKLKKFVKVNQIPPFSKLRQSPSCKKETGRPKQNGVASCVIYLLLVVFSLKFLSNFVFKHHFNCQNWTQNLEKCNVTPNFTMAASHGTDSFNLTGKWGLYFLFFKVWFQSKVVTGMVQCCLNCI